MEQVTLQKVLDRLRGLSTPDRPIFLVGGAVRDMLLDRQGHDLDFTLPGETLSVAREVANRLSGGLYVMDEERSTTRVVIDRHNRSRMLLDFAALRQSSLEGDLFDRDFTINAMAYDIASPGKLIDPTGGLADLRGKRIRACSPQSLANDPVRVLRGIRLACAYQFRILPETIQQMREAAPLLSTVSPERLRDELLRILAGPRVDLAVRVMDQVGALAVVLPELQELKGLYQNGARESDTWEHTLSTVRYLEQLMAPLVGTYREETVTDLITGSVVLWLGRYREQFEEHFKSMYVPDRTLRPLIFLTALYHEIGKSGARTADHEAPHGANRLGRRARLLVLSTQETTHIERVLRHRMRVHALAAGLPEQSQPEVSRREIFRFFKDTQEAGVDICLLSLADLRGIYGAGLPQEAWQAELKTCRAILEAYWEKRDEIVSPPRLVSGSELMRELNLQPGRIVGLLLDAIQEGQAAGEITTLEQALAFARQMAANRSTETGLSEEQG